MPLRPFSAGSANAGVRAAGNDRPIRVSAEEGHQHLHSDARDELVP